MTPEELETLINETSDPNRRATAMAALNLTRVLAPEWTHVVTVKEKGQEPRHETVAKPAGQLSGDREALQRRLDVLVAELR